MSEPFECEPLTAGALPALAELFDRAGSSCFCTYFHFDDDKNAWLMRLASDPDANRRALAERTPGASPRGVVARIPTGSVVGWMKLEPALALPKLYAQRPYRALPMLALEREGVWAVGCFLVDPAWRRRGVARALLRAGIELGRARGARALEAFPRRAEGIGDEELWTGPLGMFRDEGFEIASEQAQYPVLVCLL